MIKKKLFVMSLIIFICFSFSLVLAQDKAKALFAYMDTDKDGKVTKAEYVNFHTEYAKKIQEARKIGRASLPRKRSAAEKAADVAAYGGKKYPLFPGMDDPEEGKFAKQTKELEDFHVIGYAKNMPNIMSASDILVS